MGNCILKNETIKGKPRVYYSLIIYKKKGYYGILNDRSENVTLFQLMDSLGNLNHAISVVRYWTFDSNNEKSLVLNRESLHMLCAPSVGEEQAANFETVFTAVRYICSAEQLKKE